VDPYIYSYCLFDEVVSHLLCISITCGLKPLSFAWWCNGGSPKDIVQCPWWFLVVRWYSGGIIQVKRALTVLQLVHVLVQNTDAREQMY
jgi:hypothetical protein